MSLAFDQIKRLRDKSSWSNAVYQELQWLAWNVDRQPSESETARKSWRRWARYDPSSGGDDIDRALEYESYINIAAELSAAAINNQTSKDLL